MSSLIISHFGINPVSGGRPPSDIRIIIEVVSSVGLLVQVVPRSVMVFVAVKISVRNMAVVISR